MAGDSTQGLRLRTCLGRDDAIDGVVDHRGTEAVLGAEGSVGRRRLQVELAFEVWDRRLRPAGEEMVIGKNLFVEAVLPSAILRELTREEHDEYRRPFVEAEHRRPTLSWPRQLPIEGEPADVVEIVRSYADWLSTSDVPKLFVDADPGAILTGPQRDFVRSWPNLTEVTVAGIHYVQEDSPHEIGEAIAAWLPSLDAS